MKKFLVASVQSVPLRAGVWSEEFDENEQIKNGPFRELFGGLMWLAILTHCPDISNAVRSVARYFSAPKAIHWKVALGILAYIHGTSGSVITYQRRTSVGTTVFSSIFLPTQTTPPVKEPTGQRKEVVSVSSGPIIMCGEVHV